MRYKKILFTSLALLVSSFGFAQKAKRDYIRRGNKLYRDSVYTNAEVNYRKALEVNPESTTSMYNLGNTLIGEQKYEEAMKQFIATTKVEKDKGNLAEVYHNMGVLFYAAQDYAQAVEAYKMSLRNNPKDDETRYNLALAQKMLKDQQENKPDQGDDDQKQDQQDQDQDKDNEDQEQDQQQQQQPPQQNEDEMSKENAEQLLNSVMQDEKSVQEKVNKKQVIKGRSLEKDW